MPPQDERSSLSTGIPGLDTLLHGGIPPRQTWFVTGPPGCGKTILCTQVVFHLVSQGARAVIATITSEPNSKLIDAMSTFSFFDRTLLGDAVYLVSAYPWLKRGPSEALAMLLGSVRERRAAILLLDGFRAIGDLWRDPALEREFLYDLNVGLAAAGCVGMIATSYALEDFISLGEATTVDGILGLSMVQHEGRRLRRIEVLKLRGRSHLTGEHAMQIREDGLHVFPRLEALPAAGRAYPQTSDRAPFGLPALDQLLRGGLPRPSATIIAGSSGIGKTLLSLSFAMAGVAQEERALVVSFFDTTRALIERARRIGLDLQPGIDAEKLHLLFLPPTEMEADELIHRLLEEVRTFQIRRLVIDGIEGVALAVAPAARVFRLLAAFVLALRDLGVTTLFTNKVPKLVDAELDLGASPLAPVTENLIFLRYLHAGGTFQRSLSIMKMRDSSFDPSTCGVEISDHGIEVMAPALAVPGERAGP